MGLSGLKQRGGKELSFNNLLDLEGALLAVDPFGGETACAIVKHTTPCGLATGATALEAYQKALACDPVSAFGSVIAFTVPVDEATADRVSSLFVECIVAPEFSDARGRDPRPQEESSRARGSRELGDEQPRLQTGARRRPGAGARVDDDRRRANGRL